MERQSGRQSDRQHTDTLETTLKKGDLVTRDLPMSPGRLQVSLLRDQVPEMLRQAIVEMQLKPGDRLVERELMEWMGVSRATVREALRQLAAEGLVRTIPQKGAIVAAPTLKEAEELYEIRAMLEGRAARHFTERASDRELRELRGSFKKVERVLTGSGDTWAILQAKNHFYEVLFKGARNGILRSILGPLQARITVLRETSMSEPGRLEAMLDEIRAIVEAIEARDPEAAERLCSYHVNQAASAALAALSMAQQEGTSGD